MIAQRENLIEKKYGKPEDFINVTPGNLPDYLKSLPGEKIPSFVPVVGGRTISVRSVSELLEIGVNDIRNGIDSISEYI